MTTLHCEECGSPGADKYDGGTEAGTIYLCAACASDLLGIKPPDRMVDRVPPPEER